MYLDESLERTIKRFEDEYPDARPKQSPSLHSVDSRKSTDLDASQTENLSRLISPDDGPETKLDQGTDPYSLKLSRTSSNTSLAARALTQEEGRMHRFGQNMRREILKPHGVDDNLHGTSVNDAPESEPLSVLRKKLEGYEGDYIREQIEQRGADNVMKEFGIDLQQLKRLEEEDPEGFLTLKNAQLTGQYNAGMIDMDEFKRRKNEGVTSATGTATTHAAVTES